MSSPAVRASDDDRQRAAEALREHHAAGRLDDTELEDRIAVALSARTMGDLSAVTRDLPPLTSPPPSTRPAAAPPAQDIGGYGVRAFEQRHVLPIDRATAWREVMTHIAPSMSAYGYTVVDRVEPDYVVFEIAERPAWPLLFSVLAYLLTENRTRVVVSLRDAGPDRTEIVASGSARRPVRKAFAELSA